MAIDSELYGHMDSFKLVAEINELYEPYPNIDNLINEDEDED